MLQTYSIYFSLVFVHDETSHSSDKVRIKVADDDAFSIHLFMYQTLNSNSKEELDK